MKEIFGWWSNTILIQNTTLGPLCWGVLCQLEPWLLCSKSNFLLMFVRKQWQMTHIWETHREFLDRDSGMTYIWLLHSCRDWTRDQKVSFSLPTSLFLSFSVLSNKHVINQGQNTFLNKTSNKFVTGLKLSVFSKRVYMASLKDHFSLFLKDKLCFQYVENL